MSIALLVGDLHIDNSKSAINNSDSFYEIFQTLSLIKDSIYKYKPDYVIFFGDIFNSPYSITTAVISIISKLIYEMSTETSLIFILGNHDDVDEHINKIKIGERYINVRASLLSPFSFYPNTVVFDSPKVVKICDGVEIGFVPYSNDTISDINKIEPTFSKGVKKILMGHFDLANSNFMVYKNDQLVTTQPTAESLIRDYNYDMVLLGHIHDIENFDVDGKTVKYIGSCRNINFNNTHEEKGIYLFDFSTFDLKFIPNEFTCIYKTFSSLEEIKKYCVKSSPEKLSKTKIKYVYSFSNEVKELSKIKDIFKSLQFQKNLKGVDIVNNNKNSEAIKEFENIVNNDLVTKDNLIDYALTFKEPVDKKTTVDTLSLILKIPRDIKIEK
jgi:DNA repair exonuclease SbcCD nuclease subunit